jgi:hypothetical protein
MGCEPLVAESLVVLGVSIVGELADNARTDAKESGNILTDEPSWPQFGQHPSDLMPETAALIG